MPDPHKQCGAPTRTGSRCTRTAGRGTPREWGPCSDHLDRDLPDNAPTKLPQPLGQEAQQVYINTLYHLDRLNLYDHADEQMIVAFAINVVKMRSAYKKIKEDGWTDFDEKNDRLRKHPSAKLLRDATNDIKKLANSLGLSPNARSQISIPESEDEDESEMDQLLRGKPSA